MPLNDASEVARLCGEVARLQDENDRLRALNIELAAGQVRAVHFDDGFRLGAQAVREFYEAGAPSAALTA